MFQTTFLPGLAKGPPVCAQARWFVRVTTLPCRCQHVLRNFRWKNKYISDHLSFNIGSGASSLCAGAVDRAPCPWPMAMTTATAMAMMAPGLDSQKCGLGGQLLFGHWGLDKKISTRYYRSFVRICGPRLFCFDKKRETLIYEILLKAQPQPWPAHPQRP